MILLLYLIFMGYAIISATQLPDQVASHFNLTGQPDGWMSRSEYLYVTLIFGSGFVLFMITMSLLSRFGPDWITNIPHRRTGFRLNAELKLKNIYPNLLSGLAVGQFFSLSGWIFRLSMRIGKCPFT